MPSTFTPNIILEKIATGEQNNTWGVTEGNNWDKVDASTTGVLLQKVAISSSMTSLAFALPVRFLKFKLEWRRLVMSTSTTLGLQFSVDGGNTYLMGTTYRYVANDSPGSSVPTDNAPAIYMTPGTVSSATPMMGQCVIDATNNKMTDGFCMGYLSTGPLFRRGFFGATNDTTTATHAQLFASGNATLISGTVSLIGLTT